MMKLTYTIAALAATTLAANAAVTNFGSTIDGGLDGTDVDNWTTNNTAYAVSNGGLAFNWENVTTNTSTVDSANNEFDYQLVAGPNFTVIHGYLFNETLDLSTTTGGIEELSIQWDFNASGSTNWTPIIAVDGVFYRWNHSGNSFNGNGDLTGNTFLTNIGANEGLNATNSTWGLMPTTSDGLATGGATPNLQATSGIVQFGFGQWNASSSGSVNETGTLAFDRSRVSLKR